MRGLTHKAKIRKDLTMTRRGHHNWTNRPALTGAAGVFAFVRGLGRYGRVAMPDMSEDRSKARAVAIPALRPITPATP